MMVIFIPYYSARRQVVVQPMDMLVSVLVSGLIKGRDHSVLSTAVTGLTPPRIIALAVASAGYEVLLNNWLRCARAVSDVPIRVALYDRNATRSCTGGGSCRAAFEARIIRLSGTVVFWPAQHENHEKDGAAGIWKWRLGVLGELLDSGQADHVLLSDTDAVWVRDPVPSLIGAHRQSAIVASTAPWPDDIALKWGQQYGFHHSLCMGFISFDREASQFVQALWRDCEALSLPRLPGDYACDDQLALNSALLQSSASWHPQPHFPDGSGRWAGGWTTHTATANPLPNQTASPGPPIQIAALSSEFIFRGDHPNLNAAAIHVVPSFETRARSSMRLVCDCSRWPQNNVLTAMHPPRAP